MIAVPPVYAPLYTDRERFTILLTGGRGSGKSFNAMLFAARLSFETGHGILCARWTMASAADSVIPEFREKAELDGTERYFRIGRTGAVNLRSGTPVLFRGIKTASGNQTAKLKSIQGLTTFIGDEMEEWTDEESYDRLTLSIRRKGVRNRSMLVMNPTNDEHFVYRRWLANSANRTEVDGVDVQLASDPDVLHIHTTYLDNLDNLSPAFLERIAKIRAESIAGATDASGRFDRARFQASRYATAIIGRWADARQGAVLTRWEIGDFDDALPYCYGWDFGFSVDPTALVRCAVDERRKAIYADEEYYDARGLGTAELAALARARTRREGDLIVADSAEPRLIADLRREGINAAPCRKGPGSVAASLLRMADYTITVTPRSANLMRELRNYVWNDRRAGIPVDDSNHAIDALRYAFDRLATGASPELAKKRTIAAAARARGGF